MPSFLSSDRRNEQRGAVYQAITRQCIATFKEMRVERDVGFPVPVSASSERSREARSMPP